MQRMLLVVITIVFLLFPFLKLAGQTFNYLSYTTRDGLAGNMVYDMCQDEEGFLWFGTDNGVSRFDGQQFFNYTVRDGLADNEVVRLHLDKRGRLWFCTFSNSLSYYFQGRFYNKDNDSVLAKNVPNSRPLGFFESKDGSLWILCQQQLFCLPESKPMYEVKFDPPLVNRVKTSISFGQWWFEKGIPLVFNDSIFYLDNSNLVFYGPTSNQAGLQTIYGVPWVSGDTPRVNLGAELIHTTWRNQFPHLAGTLSGAFEIDYANWKVLEHFLPGKTVTRAMVDKEGIYWFATMGDGVFKLPSKTAKTYSLPDGVYGGKEVFSIASRNDTIMTGHGGSRLMIWRKGIAIDSIVFDKYLPLVENRTSTNRLKFIYPLNGGDWLLGFDGFLLSWNRKVKSFFPINALKTFETEGDSIALVASGQNVLRMRLNPLEVTDTVWNFRATSALSHEGASYIGTLQGLYEVDKGGRVINWGDQHPALQRRIAALQWHNKSLWVATSDSGLVEIIPGKGIGRLISEADGLSSNICRTLNISRGQMWVGTNNGICKIDLIHPERPFAKYNSFNLLPNDLVNAIMLRGIQVYVGSPAGLSVFEESDVNSQSICRLHINRISSTDGMWNEPDKIVLNYKGNRLDIDYIGISMKSAGDIRYHYRMEGLDVDWNTTAAKSITYNVIPPGSYTFWLYAVNKFGVKSNVIRMSIKVNAPLWYSPWFWLVCLLLLGGLAAVYVHFRNKRLHGEWEEKNRIQRQLAELEQKALQAQMNPHFIFNSLNSIQQYILTSNVEDANRYLSIFARLIRETLENSSSGKISLEREIDYLNKYLQLEKMRFGNSFDFKIHTNGLEGDSGIELPVMLLQPYIENAVRHGIRYLTSGNGMIDIGFSIERYQLVCRIRDNGIGRSESARLKSLQHIEYQSKGMDLTQRRVDILNKVFDDKVNIEIHDLLNTSGMVCGTEVVVTITQNTYEPSYQNYSGR